MTKKLLMNIYTTRSPSVLGQTFNIFSIGAKIYSYVVDCFMW